MYFRVLFCWFYDDLCRVVCCAYNRPRNSELRCLKAIKMNENEYIIVSVVFVFGLFGQCLRVCV